MWYKNITGMFFGLVTKHAFVGRTDGQTELRLPRRASIAASRGKNLWTEKRNKTTKIKQSSAMAKAIGGRL